MSAEQGDVEAIRAALAQTPFQVRDRRKDAVALAALDRLAASLERAELDRDEAIESWQYWRAHGDRELRARAEKAECALAETRAVVPSLISFALATPTNEASKRTRDSVVERARAALRSEDTSDE